MVEEYNVQEIMADLKEKSEMDPDRHDGCYELMRETIAAYSKLKDFSKIDYRDLNLVYLTTIGTWKQGLESKKKTVAESHLPQEDKEYLTRLWDDIWERANRGEYDNYERDASGNSSIGLFGTGFFSFQRTTSTASARAFIWMCCDILPMTDDNEMFSRAASVLTSVFQGMRAASASMILHCLKPYSFPILNANSGNKNIFEVIGVDLYKTNNLDTYIENCRRIKAFRDANFSYKNYRIFDIESWKLAEYAKRHEHGKYGNWEILSESTARLDCRDRELVLNVTVIPEEIIWFFRLSQLHSGGKQDVVLVHDGFEYDGYFLRESLSPIRIRLFWDKILSEEIGAPAHDGREVFLEFNRLEDNRFDVRLDEPAQSDEKTQTGKAWLITWNKKNWSWDGYERLCLETKNGHPFCDEWACISSKPRVGEDVFLLKLGEAPKGIVGHGKVVREQYEKDHYDPVKAAQGIRQKAIDVEFDRLLDYGHEKILSQAELIDKCQGQQWSPQGSGIEIRQEVLPTLRELWDEVAKDEWWPDLSEYDPGITVQEYHDLFLTERVVRRPWLEALYEMYMMPDHLGTCKQMGDRYGYAPSHYVSYLAAAASNIAKETNCPILPREEKDARYWPVLFQGKHTTDKSQGSYCWKMRDPVIEAIEMLIDEGIFTAKENRAMAQFDHNMILYGPPGTGKTYNSVIYAVAICEGRTAEDVMKESYQEVLQRYRELQEAGRVAFTTFHQSYGYEEFIEGIKPKLDDDCESLGYSIEDGVFKDFCRHANPVSIQAKSGIKIKDHPRIWIMILGGPDMTPLKQECFNNNEVRIGWPEVEDGQWDDDEDLSWRAKQMLHAFAYEMEPGDVVFIQKDSQSIDAIGVIAGEYEYDKSLGEYPRKRKVEWIAKNIEEDMAQYLPRGKKKLARFTVYSVDYLGTEVLSEILKKYIDEDEVSADPDTKPYVFIIDEINRGNISKIFGELITLIEETKRSGASEAMEAILPYSGEPFSVPQNVYILGTMNTADRSIALMDTALRRRFEFTEMMPNSEVLESLGVGTITVDGEELNVARMLDVINERIEFLFDREHTIGHAFFIKLVDDASLETLAGIFEKNVIPLLQEYFYEDYEKIQLVLGDNAKEDEFKFVLDKPLRIKDIFSGNPDIDLPEKGYVIQREAFYKLESYKQIGKGL